MPLVVDIAQCPCFRVGRKEFYSGDFVSEYYTENDVSQLMNGSTQPGNEVGPCRPESPPQGVKREMGNKMNQETENEDTGKQGYYLTEG